jgi:hypothetical protein
MLKFFDEHPDAGAGKLSRNKALDIVRKNMFWVDKQEKDLLDIIQNIDYGKSIDIAIF